MCRVDGLRLVVAAHLGSRAASTWHSGVERNAVHALGSTPKRSGPECGATRRQCHTTLELRRPGRAAQAVPTRPSAAGDVLER
jgi:hypothetical protein